MSKRTVPFARPLIDEDAKQAVLAVLESGWLSTGQVAHQFEAEFAARVGSAHAIALNSCTAALHLAMATIGLDEGDEVLTTPLTFAATAEVALYFKARPVLIDIHPDTFNIDPARIEQERGLSWHPGRAKAIIPVHFAGLPCDMDAILAIGRHEGLTVVEDAAHAFPARYGNRMIGSVGDMTCFSFYATKTITTGEGGMITTDNPDWAETLRVLSCHGISHNAWNRYTERGTWYYEILRPGYKYNMPDIAGALGRAQLAKADALLARRGAIAAAYDSAFADHPALEVPPRPRGQETTHSWHLYVLRLNTERLRIDRARFIEELKELGVHTSVHFIPLHIHPYYRDTFGYRPEDFPQAYRLYQRIFSLPIYPGLDDAEVAYVADSVRSIADGFMA